MTRKSKRRIRIKPRFFIFLALMGLVLFLVLSWGHRKLVYLTADTVSVKQGTIEKAVKLDALLAKKGPVLTAKSDGTLKIVAADGEQVAKGKELFQIINDSIQIRYDDDLIRIDSSIKKLKDEWSKAASDYDKKIAAFDRQAKDLLKKQANDAAGLSMDDQESLQFAMLQGQQATKQRSDEQKDYAKKIKTLETKKAAMQAEYADNMVIEKAAAAGVLSYSTGKTQVPWADSAAAALDDDDLAGMKQLTRLEDASVLTKGQNIAQLIDPINVRLVCRITEDALQEMDLKDDYPIIFDDYGNDRTMGKLIAMGNSNSGKRTIVLECQKWLKEFSRISATKITVIKKSYSGIIIPQKSLVKRQGIEGVYLKKDGAYSFVPVKIRGIIGTNIAVTGITSGSDISVEPAKLTKLVKE